MVKPIDILITGGAGVVGRSLCRDFLARGKTVRVLTLPGDFSARELPPEVDVFYGDVTRPETLASAFAGANTVCHLAAVILAKRPSDYDRINLGGTRNALAAARAAGASPFVYISRISVTYPVLTVYGRCKAAGEELVAQGGEVGVLGGDVEAAADHRPRPAGHLGADLLRRQRRQVARGAHGLADGDEVRRAVDQRAVHVEQDCAKTHRAHSSRRVWIM